MVPGRTFNAAPTLALLVFLLLLCVRNRTPSSRNTWSGIRMKTPALINCWLEGEWIFNASRVPYRNGLTPNKCKDQNSWKWMWKPFSQGLCRAAPEWLEVDSAVLCALLRHRNVLLIGDSLSGQMFYTLSEQLGGRQVYHVLGRDRHAKSVEISSLGCNGTVWISFVRNDFLHDVNEYSSGYNIQPEQGWMLHPFRHLLHNHSVIVLNRGLHFQPNGLFAVELNRTLRFLAAEFPNHVLIYRTTTPGHVNCSAYRAPLRAPKAGVQFDSLYNWSNAYNWNEMPFQNEIAKEIVLHPQVAGHVMDVYAMTRWRPDNHIKVQDCVHYCSPGPVELWMIYFYNLLRVLQPS